MLCSIAAETDVCFTPLFRLSFLFFLLLCICSTQSVCLRGGTLPDLTAARERESKAPHSWNAVNSRLWRHSQGICKKASAGPALHSFQCKHSQRVLHSSNLTLHSQKQSNISFMSMCGSSSSVITLFHIASYPGHKSTDARKIKPLMTKLRCKY